MSSSGTKSSAASRSESNTPITDGRVGPEEAEEAGGGGVHENDEFLRWCRLDLRPCRGGGGGLEGAASSLMVASRSGPSKPPDLAKLGMRLGMEAVLLSTMLVINGTPAVEEEARDA